MKRSIAMMCAALALWAGPAAAESTHARDETDAPSELERAASRVAWMTLRSHRLHTWLRKARQARDGRRSRCLDGLLSQAHAVERQGIAELTAIERLVRGEEQAGLAFRLARLDRFAARSQHILKRASRCGKKVSRRARTPTYYRVTVIRP